MAGVQRSPGARQMWKSRNLPCSYSYNFHQDVLVPGVTGSVPAGGEKP